MGNRTIIGRLAAEPEEVPAGKITIVKFRVIENTYDFREGKRVPHETPTTHFVEAKFELGQNAHESLHTGDEVIVVGREHSDSYDGDEGAKRYVRVVEAAHIGASLNHATAVITRNPRDEE